MHCVFILGCDVSPRSRLKPSNKSQSQGLVTSLSAAPHEWVIASCSCHVRALRKELFLKTLFNCLPPPMQEAFQDSLEYGSFIQVFVTPTPEKGHQDLMHRKIVGHANHLLLNPPEDKAGIGVFIRILHQEYLYNYYCYYYYCYY